MRSINTFLAVLAVSLLAPACATRLSDHPVAPADIGVPSSTSAMLAALKTPDAVRLKTVVAADWRFTYTSSAPDVTPPRWEQGELDAQVFFYEMQHPKEGLILIDAGLPADAIALIDPVTRAALSIEEKMTIREPTARALAGAEPRAVLLTHLHYDHVLGVRDLPASTPIYAGPGDGAQRSFFNNFVAPSTARALEGRPPLKEWQFTPDPDGRLAGVIDVFGDGSVFAIHVPGHTPGSTAYVVNAVDGVHLITGDTAHGRDAWLGTRIDRSAFDPDLQTLWHSLAQLKAVAADIPGLIVHPGHQAMAGKI